MLSVGVWGVFVIDCGVLGEVILGDWDGLGGGLRKGYTVRCSVRKGIIRFGT